MSKRGLQRHKQERRDQRLAVQREARAFENVVPIIQTEESRALDVVDETIERAKSKSIQPRFTSPAGVFSSTWNWVNTCMASEPRETASARTWDQWYCKVVRREPFLVSIMNAAVQIDKNRGWTLTGGKNQVKKYTDIVHGFDDGAGWRTHIDWLAQSYYKTRMGFVAEIGRAGRMGPMIRMWAFDPCRLELTGNPDKPLKYYPRAGGSKELTPDLYIRGESLVSTEEEQLTYGYPAVARCYDFSKIMIGVYSHYQQKVGTRTPDAILTGKFIGDEQWNLALEARDEVLDTSPENYLNSIATFFNNGSDMPEFALTFLSSLPDRWDIEVWTKVLMRGYELAFGYQGEFYPESAGVLGRGNEVQIQHRNATAQGGKDFILTHQEKLQSVLPPTLQFEYDERDVTGEIEDAQLQIQKADLISKMTQWALNGQSVLTPEQIMTLAAEKGLVPEEWTPQSEDVTSTDTEDAEEETEAALESERVQRAIKAFPNEPIVRYSWPSGKTRILRMGRRRSFHIQKVIEPPIIETEIHQGVEFKESQPSSHLTELLSRFDEALIDFRVAMKSPVPMPEPREIILKSNGPLIPPTNVNIERDVVKPPVINVRVEPANFTINIPQLEPPIVNVNVDPTPITVENSVQVDPTPIAVENSVQVDPTPITISNMVNVPTHPVELSIANSTSVIKRNAAGQISEIDSFAEVNNG